jgi:hypothetical protein
LRHLQNVWHDSTNIATLTFVRFFGSYYWKIY